MTQAIRGSGVAFRRLRFGRPVSGVFRQNGARRRDGIGVLRGALVSTAKLTDRIVRTERDRARSVRQHDGELPLGWTTARAEARGVSRTAYEKALYGESYRHLCGALSRPSVHSRRRVWNGPQ